MIINLFNLLDVFQVPIFEFDIIFCLDNLHHHSWPYATSVFLLVDPNTICNVILLYYGPGGPINCLLFFFNPDFEVIVDDVKKLWMIKVLMNILLKFRRNMFTIFFDSQYFFLDKFSLKNIFLFERIFTLIWIGRSLILVEVF